MSIKIMRLECDLVQIVQIQGILTDLEVVDLQFYNLAL